MPLQLLAQYGDLPPQLAGPVPENIVQSPPFFFFPPYVQVRSGPGSVATRRSELVREFTVLIPSFRLPTATVHAGPFSRRALT